MWSMGAAHALSLQHGVGWGPPAPHQSTGNPLGATYATSDGRFLSLCCLQAGRYWPEFCQLVDRPDLAADERYADAASIRANAGAATDALRAMFAQRAAAEWQERLATFSGQWAMVQDTLEAASDPQTIANGYVQECATADGTAFKLAGAPVHYGGEAPAPRRAPEFNEHGEQILADLGLDWDTVIDLKVRGVVA